MDKPITGDFYNPTFSEQVLAKAIARFDYWDKPVNRDGYSTEDKYVNEWWEERYIPVVRWIRRNR